MNSHCFVVIIESSYKIYILFCKRFVKVQVVQSYKHSRSLKGGLYGVVVNLLKCNVLVSEFELQSRNYVHFRTNILGKDMDLLSL